MADAKTTESVKSLKTADQLAAKRVELEDLRSTDIREWSLNRAFYNNQQWVLWNRMTNQVESIPVQDGDKPRWKVRLTSNQIRSGVQHYVAQLTKTKPVITATPDSSSYRDRQSAELANCLYEWWWQELQVKSKLQSVLMNATISQGWWKITWDPLAGKSMKLTLGPDGKPITDQQIVDIYTDELRQVAEQQGADPKQILDQFTKTVYVGDIRIEALPGENVLIDPAPSKYEEARYAFCKHVLDVDEIEERFGKRVTPNASTSTSVPLMYSKVEKAPKNVRDVYIAYFRPTPLMPEGRYVVWLEDPNVILADEKWPYPFNELPLVKFPGVEKPGCSQDEPLVSDVRPLQKELNRTLSQIVQFKDMTIKPQMIAPIGSLRQRLTDEPGAVFEYQPVQGLSPEWRQTPRLDSSSFNVLADIQGRIDKMFNRIPSGRDQLPARMDAGYGVELIQEAVADQLSPVIQRMEESLSRAGKLMVMLAQEYYIEPRLLKIKGEGGSTQVRKFINSDLAGGFSFRPESGSGLPRSRAGRQQQVLELAKAELIDKKQALRYLDLADLKGIQAQFEADEDQAYREHEKMIKGEPTNMFAVRKAMQQVQQMMNDPTADMDGDGQPEDPQTKQMYAQQMLQQAAVEPLEFEDFDNHATVHALFMKSPEFERLPDDVQERFNMHFEATAAKIQEMHHSAATMDPKIRPKVSMNFKGTASAATATKILNEAGIPVDEQEVSEPPLETAVYDSADKPNMQDTANAHMDSVDKQLKIDIAEEQHQMTQAIKAHGAALDQEKSDHQRQMDQMTLAHEQDMHSQKMAHTEAVAAQKSQHADEMHDVKKKQAAKPKPAGGK